MQRFSKSSGPLLNLKQAFFDDNAALLAEGQRIGAVYRAQPARVACKNCEAPLGPPTFVKLDISYIVCDRCGHLNGAHEDTDAFCASMYTEDRGKKYAKNYAASDVAAYKTRTASIYVPKAEFLRDALRDAGQVPKSLSFADFGAGTGYFVAAMKCIGLETVVGYEVSDQQSAMANAMIGEGSVIRHDLEEVIPIARSVTADVVSMIGVLEHVQKPRDVLAALKANPAVRYLYISVPLFSPCVFLEMVFPSIFQRQLSAGHTHLYTESSLDWMSREFGLKRISEWWFGTDMVDLFRYVTVGIGQSQSEGAGQHWAASFAPVIDDLQAVLDKRKMSSEVHMLFELVR
ncbi:MAG: methyltransferase domain-containing protein [Hyphomicrobium sp.]